MATDTLRVSATDIDALRYFMANEDADLGELLTQLRRESGPTEAMMVGTALHAALEVASPGDFVSLSANGFTFAFEAEGEIDLPDIREIKATREYEIGDCLVTLVGKVDAIHGRRVDDHKYTSRYDAERFMASMQWRIYLDVFGADEFRWNIFEGRQDSDDPQRYVIYAIHRLSMHRYPGMSDDIETAIRAFVDFSRQHLPERITPLPPAPFATVRRQLKASANILSGG